MSDQTETRARRHGKTGVSSVTHHPELYLHRFATLERGTPLPTIPTTWDGTGGLSALTMLGNGPDPDNPAAYPDGVGDCVRVSEQNGRKFAAVTGVDADGTITYEEGFRAPHTPWTVAGYFEYGLAMGWHGQPPAPEDEPDMGADPATYAKWMFKTKQTEVIAEIDLRNPAEAVNNIRRAATEFNGVAITVTLAAANMDQFDEGVPFTAGPTSNEGHGLWYCKWDELYDYVATWAEVHKAEPTWLPSVITSAWVYGTKELFKNRGYNAEAIIAAAEALVNPEVAPSAGFNPPPNNAQGTPFDPEHTLVHDALHDIETLPGAIHHILTRAIAKEADTVILDALEELIARFR
jgi:hypothetical protein